jgi:hypothetical protein
MSKEEMSDEEIETEVQISKKDRYINLSEEPEIKE